MIRDQFLRLGRILRHNPRALTRLPAKLAEGALGLSRYARDLVSASHGQPTEATSFLTAILKDPPRPPREKASEIESLSRLYLEHRFCLLGSGWQRPAHGAACPGVGGAVFPPGPVPAASPGGQWPAGRINRANLPYSRSIWQQIQGPYQPIDWQLDFRSGYRWSEKTWYLYVPYGHHRGVDIKLPWELARMQHLPTLAQAWALAGGQAGPGDCLREFCNQILDFIATNPPRFGVNWACTMEVAIRAVNWLLSFELFRSWGAEFPPGFQAALAGSVADHAAHIAANLEWNKGQRGNHYLADVVGLLFCAAYLPESARQTEWLRFAVRQLVREVDHQFLSDGGNFEASTCYHRLAGEMVLYGTALALGLPQAKLAALAKDCPGFKPGEAASLFPDWYFAKLRRILDFALSLPNPAGGLPQIGDNDSGRLCKLAPVLRLMDGTWWDNTLDAGHLAAAAAGLGLQPPAELASPGQLWERDLVAALAKGARPLAWPAAEAATPLPRPAGAWQKAQALAQKAGVRYSLDFHPQGHDLQGLEIKEYPEFGLYVFRARGLYMCLRCGPFNHDGTGAHAHLDQLGLELWHRGRPLVRDPGSVFYTPFPDLRDQYRDARAHFVPLPKDGTRAGDFSQGVFRLADRCRARCHYCGPRGFWGSHHGFGFAVHRVVELTSQGLAIYDESEPPGRLLQRGPRDLSLGWQSENAPFSEGYGFCPILDK